MSENKTDDEPVIAEEIHRQGFTGELSDSYLEYAMSVIGGRALPDVRDGLKPVHRRVLFAMDEEGLGPNGTHRKSSSITGTTMGDFHPHGDKSIYDALVRMSQPFSLQAPLVDGQGNFGSMDGDPAAAMRYTEARLSKFGQRMLQDLSPKTVDFEPNYDDRTQEPTVLPAAFPNLLVNGAEGIAVGMSTKIPPHNPREVINATIEYIQQDGDVDVEDMMEYIQGPEFPTGGQIIGVEGIKEAYKTGRGTITVRGKYHFEDDDIIITDIPYQDRTRKNELIKELAELVQNEEITGIKNFRDESDKDVRIVVELKQSAFPEVVANKIMSSVLEKTYGIILIALVDGEPRRLTLTDIIEHYVDHRRDVLLRRSEDELEEAEDRAHILEGRLKALENVESIVELIQDSDGRSEAQDQLRSKYDFSEDQAQHVVRMQLGSLTSLEEQEIEDEYSDLQEEIDRLQKIIESPKQLDELVIEELEDVREDFYTERRTEIVRDTDNASIDQKDFIAQEEQVLVQTENNYFKRVDVEAITSYSRGSKGLSAVQLRDEDSIKEVYSVNTHDEVFFFTDHGNVYTASAYQIPDQSRQSRGKPAVTFLDLDDEEQVVTVFTGDPDDEKEMVFVTENGLIKKTSYEEYNNIYSSGLKAIALNKDDRLADVHIADGTEDILIGSTEGRSIRFSLSSVSETGRRTKGVFGMDLPDTAKVAGSGLIQSEQDVVYTVCENGFGKGTLCEKYNGQARNGKGSTNIKSSERNGSVTDIEIVSAENRDSTQFLLAVDTGRVLRSDVTDWTVIGRNTKGYTVMDVDGSSVVSLNSAVFDNNEQDDE